MDATTPLDTLEVLLLDCQASGASPKHGEIIDIAWCATSARALRASPPEIHGHLVALPEGSSLPRRVQKITGITQQMLSSAPDQEEVARALGEHLPDADTLAVPVAHYARFERPFVHALLERVELHDRLAPYLCTHAIAQRLMPGLPRRGLRAIAGYFGEMLPEEKRAEVHVFATAIIWREVVELLVEEEEVTTLGELRDWLVNKQVDRSARREFPLERSIRLGLPSTPGVYRMLNRNDQILYVGKATSLKSRVNSYFRGKKGGGERKLEMATQVWAIDVTETSSPLEAALLETDEIKRHAPPYNVQLKVADRQIWFSSSSDLTLRSSTPSEVFDLGPYGSSMALESMQLLLDSLRDEAPALDLFFSLEDEQIYLDALEILAARYPELADTSPQADAFLALGEVLWRERLAALELERAEASLALDEEDEDEDEEEERGEIEWTAELAAGAFERVIRGHARSTRRGAFLQTLLDADLVWQPPHFPDAPARILQMRAGQVIASGAIDEVASCTLPERRDPLKARALLAEIDIYDRLTVLLKEMRRLARDATFLQVHRAGEEPRDRDALADLLRLI